MKTHLNIFTLLCALGLNTADAADNMLQYSSALSREPLANSSTTLGGNLDGLLDYAREHNPGLAASRFEAEAAALRAEPADALPDPVLRIEPMDVTRQSGETRFLLMQSVPWFGKRGLQREVAASKVAQADGQVSASWTELANRIKTAYAMLYFTVESERLAQQTLGLLDGLEQIARTRYSNGLASQQDVIQVQVEQTMLRGELIALQNERHHSHARLNALLSRPSNAALAEPKQLRAMPSVAELDEAAMLERLLARNPQLRIAEADIQSAEKNRELSRANRYPDFTLGIAPTRSGSAIKQWDLMLELNIPLQQSSRRAQEGEAAAMVSASNARKQALLDQMQSELSEALSALDSARRTESLIATRLLPQAELTYQSALAGYENGKVDFAMLVEAQKQILKAKQQQLQTQTDMQLRLADIEKLLGEE
ncbi:MAG: TolC family protein [Sideroxydans sp.]|nr:TolC family protein [Sideroxydans sp.]